MTRDQARRWLADVALCLPLLAFTLFATPLAARNQPQAARAPDAAGYALVAVAALAVAARRTAWLGLMVNAAAIVVYLTAGYPYGPILLTVPVMVYSVAVRSPARYAIAATGTYFGVILTTALVKEWREAAGTAGAQYAWLALAWSAIASAALAVGIAVRVRRESVARVRVEQAQRAASEERLLMAQDLHDTIGHGLAVIAMQAGVALHVLDRDPDRARESMNAVRATSRESLDNLRARLEALRSAGAGHDRRPTPGLADVVRLADRVRAGGVEVTVHIDPDLPELPAAVDAAAYRILQESLTNVLRHVGESTARIRVTCGGGELLLDVTDSGRADRSNGARPVPSAGGGSGIRGMRAQAQALGGRLDAGPRPGGGFAVAARLPLSIVEDE